MTTGVWKWGQFVYSSVNNCNATRTVQMTHLIFHGWYVVRILVSLKTQLCYINIFLFSSQVWDKRLLHSRWLRFASRTRRGVIFASCRSFLWFCDIWNSGDFSGGYINTRAPTEGAGWPVGGWLGLPSSHVQRDKKEIRYPENENQTCPQRT